MVEYKVPAIEGLHIKAWVNAGTTNKIFIRRVLVVSLTILVIYKLGYAIGVFLAHIGL